MPGIIKLVYECMQWELNVYVNMGNDQAHSHSCPIVARTYVFARFKTLNDISDVAVVGSIVSKLFKIYTIDIQAQVFVYKFQCLTMMEFPLCFPSALWL